MADLSDLVLSKLFWVTTVQWFLLMPAVTLAQGLCPRFSNSPLITSFADLAIFFLVGFLILAVPLFPLELYPLPIAGQKGALIAGFIVGGAASVFLRRRVYGYLSTRHSGQLPGELQ